VETSNTPTIRHLTPSCRHQLSRIARVGQTISARGFRIPEFFFGQVASLTSGIVNVSSAIDFRSGTPGKGGIIFITEWRILSC
jgi:hypothetical protein